MPTEIQADISAPSQDSLRVPKSERLANIPHELLPFFHQEIKATTTCAIQIVSNNNTTVNEATPFKGFRFIEATLFHHYQKTHLVGTTTYVSHYTGERLPGCSDSV